MKLIAILSLAIIVCVAGKVKNHEKVLSVDSNRENSKTTNSSVSLADSIGEYYLPHNARLKFNISNVVDEQTLYVYLTF